MNEELFLTDFGLMEHEAPLIEGHLLGSHRLPIQAISSTKEGNIAVTAAWDKLSRAWSVTGREHVREFDNSDGDMLMGCAVSHDGKRVATASMDGALKLWNVLENRCIAVLRSQDRQLKNAVDCWISDDGSRIACVFSFRTERSEIVFFDWASTDSVYRRSTLNVTHRARRLSISESAGTIAITTLYNNKRRAVVYNLDSFEELRNIELSDSLDNQWDSHICCSSGDANSIVVADNEKLLVIDPHDANFDVELSGFDPPTEETPCSISGDGSKVIAPCANGVLGLWSVPDNRILARFSYHSSTPLCSHISFNSSWIFLGFVDGSLRVYSSAGLENENMEATNESEIQRIFNEELYNRRIQAKNEMEKKISDFEQELRNLKTKSALQKEKLEKFVTRAEIVKGAAENIRDLIFQLNQSSNVDGKGETEMRTESEQKLAIIFEIAKILGIVRSIDEEETREHALSTEQCVVCLENINDGDEVVRLPCMHVFQKECLLPYLSRQHNPCCPICRMPVEVNDLDHLPVWNWNQ